VLLDVDGTLVDSNDGHARAWVTDFAESGVTVRFAKVRRLIGSETSLVFGFAVGLVMLCVLLG
jgi:beta-phosphoglucomutase-like phosphatase (HAD superfamily)